jgi:organic hydroperoxide reductase OsmC/OhrA
VSHRYDVRLVWSGDHGTGTSDYRAYGRDHRILVAGKPEIAGSADPAFRGDGARHNPEDLLVAALAACHMLWYLHLCANAGVVVVAYEDTATGRMSLEADGGGRFDEVTLHPRVTIRRGEPATAEALHAEAHRRCFIANSMNFPVRHRPVIRVAGH